MLHIRPQQMDALNLARLRAFEQQAIAYVQDVWPDECAALGTQRLEEVVRSSIQGALACDIVTERGVLRYLNIVFALGTFGDELPPPIAAALDDRSRGETERIADLHQRALWHVQTK